MGYVLGYVGHILLLVLAILVLVLTLLVLSLFAAPEPDGPCHFAVPFFLSLVPFSPPAGCGGPALLHSAHHVIITTAVGTPLCWRLTTRCHRALPSQVSYGWIGWVGVGIQYSKPFVCICKHTATRIRIWRGCPGGGRFPPGECFLALGFALLPVLLIAVPATSPTRPQDP